MVSRALRVRKTTEEGINQKFFSLGVALGPMAAVSWEVFISMPFIIAIPHEKYIGLYKLSFYFSKVTKVASVYVADKT